ncbi:MAG: cytochrome c3 family protein [Pseudomonadota bacterium]
MKNYIRITAFLILLTAVQAGFANQNAKTKSTAYCLRCHGMETLAYRDTITGKVVNLYVNPQQYRQSNHKRLECTTCHTADYSHYPHPDNSENLYCLDCHKDDPKFTPYRFTEIEQAFKNSIHAIQFPTEFSCFSCHDPHQFKVSRVGEDISEIVRYDNEICLNCHASLLISHQWLPNQTLHWRSIRCIECHFSHKILPAKESVKNCVECHSKEATLLSRLYKYRSQEDLQKTGWFNKAVFNNAYIIGMSRNETIDRWSLIILVLTICGLFAHGLGRFLATKARSHKK